MSKTRIQNSKSPDAQPAKKFAQMTPSEKCKHIGKVFVFFLTLGFIFPTLFSD